MNSARDCNTPMLTRTRSKCSRRWKQYVAAISVSFGAFCAGTVLSWTSPALGHILQENSTSSPTEQLSGGYPGFTVTQSQGAMIGSTLTFGALVSAIPIGYLADRIGRKNTILGLSVSFLVNWILLIFSVNVETVMVARIFAGVGLGGVCVVAPMYIGEIAEASNRGRFGSFFQLFLSSGILFTCIVGYLTNWLGLAIVLATTPILFGGSFLFMPETPNYLVRKNRLVKAEKNLKYLRGISYDVSVEMKSIQLEIEESQKRTASFSYIFTKANLKAVISVIGVLAFQQLSGINAIVFYTVTIFQAAGSSISPFLAAIITNSVQVVISYVSIIIIEKANRKLYLIASSAGMMLSLASLGMFFHLKSLQIDTKTIAYLPLGSTLIYMAFFSIGYGPVPWMLLGELFAPEIKGVASGMAILANWIFAFVVTLLFPIVNANLGEYVAFYILAAFMAVGTVFVYFVVPETRGKTLAQIQEELNR